MVLICGLVLLVTCVRVIHSEDAASGVASTTLSAVGHPNVTGKSKWTSNTGSESSKLNILNRVITGKAEYNATLFSTASFAESDTTNFILSNETKDRNYTDSSTTENIYNSTTERHKTSADRTTSSGRIAIENKGLNFGPTTSNSRYETNIRESLVWPTVKPTSQSRVLIENKKLIRKGSSKLAFTVAAIIFGSLVVFCLTACMAVFISRQFPDPREEERARRRRHRRRKQYRHSHITAKTIPKYSWPGLGPDPFPISRRKSSHSRSFSETFKDTSSLNKSLGPAKGPVIINPGSRPYPTGAPKPTRPPEKGKILRLVKVKQDEVSKWFKSDTKPLSPTLYENATKTKPSKTKYENESTPTDGKRTRKQIRTSHELGAKFESTANPKGIVSGGILVQKSKSVNAVKAPYSEIAKVTKN